MSTYCLPAACSLPACSLQEMQELQQLHLQRLDSASSQLGLLSSLFGSLMKLRHQEHRTLGPLVAATASLPASPPSQLLSLVDQRMPAMQQQQHHHHHHHLPLLHQCLPVAQQQPEQRQAFDASLPVQAIPSSQLLLKALQLTEAQQQQAQHQHQHQHRHHQHQQALQLTGAQQQQLRLQVQQAQQLQQHHHRHQQQEEALKLLLARLGAALGATVPPSQPPVPAPGQWLPASQPPPPFGPPASELAAVLRMAAAQPARSAWAGGTSTGLPHTAGPSLEQLARFEVQVKVSTMGMLPCYCNRALGSLYSLYMHMAPPADHHTTATRSLKPAIHFPCALQRLREMVSSGHPTEAAAAVPAQAQSAAALPVAPAPQPEAAAPQVAATAPPAAAAPSPEAAAAALPGPAAATLAAPPLEPAQAQLSDQQFEAALVRLLQAVVDAALNAGAPAGDGGK